MNLSYFIVTCEEVDLFDGKIIHLNKKAKDVEEVSQIIKTYMSQYPLAHWELYPCQIKTI